MYTYTNIIVTSKKVGKRRSRVEKKNEVGSERALTCIIYEGLDWKERSSSQIIHFDKEKRKRERKREKEYYIWH